jgi:sarcosine oxidase subunit delta
MNILNCPLNGPRNISEFAYGGEVQEMPAPDAELRDWAAYVFIENNTRGLVREWWIHLPTSYWFIVERNTESNDVMRTYPADELYSERVRFGSDD